MRKTVPCFSDTLVGCLKNNNKNKEVIYKTYYGYLVAVILRYINDRNDIEELVNDSFVKVFKGLNTFIFPANLNETELAFKGWMSKIASRTAIDFLRSKRHLIVVTNLAECQEPIVEVNVVNAINVKDILKLLNQLPHIQRIVFNMYEVEGFSHTEIAKILSIPDSSSRVYLTRAKNRLRTLYANSLITHYAKS